MDSGGVAGVQGVCGRGVEVRPRGGMRVRAFRRAALREACVECPLHRAGESSALTLGLDAGGERAFHFLQ